MQGGAWMKKEKLRKEVLHLVCTRATQNGSFSTLLPPTPRAYVPREKILAKNCFIGFLDQLVSLFSSLYTAAPLPNSTDYNYFRKERRSELDWGAQGVMERDEVKIAFIFFPKVPVWLHCKTQINVVRVCFLTWCFWPLPTSYNPSSSIFTISSTICPFFKRSSLSVFGSYDLCTKPCWFLRHHVVTCNRT